MKWLMRAVLAVIVLTLLFVGIGFLLPSQFHVERSVVINAPAEKVYALISDPREWKRWTVWNRRDPAMRIEYAGPPSGVGARWAWQSKTEGNGEMEFTEAVPPNRLGYRLSFPEFGMHSKGLLRVVPDGAGVRVSWSNEGDMGTNPLNRWFGLMMDRLVGPDFEGGLVNLKRLAESS
jgi:uncharacterized protein YndB with AHSA1/START domain